MSREVHLADKFLLDAVQQFRADRGPHGEPSAKDFFDRDLDTIMFDFTEMWDALDLWQVTPTTGNATSKERAIETTGRYYRGHNVSRVPSSG